MDSDVESILKATQGTPNVQAFQGTFVSLNSDGTVTVDVQGTRIQANPWTSYRPQVNDAVALLAIDQNMAYIGAAAVLPGRGSVVSTASNQATISTDIGNVVATYTSGQTLTPGQIVKLYWQDGPHVIGALSTTPPTPPAPPDQGTPSATQHTDLFTTLDAGTWNASSGWWQSQVWASDTTIGAWFYGSKISDTIGGGVVQSIQIYLPVVQKYGNAPNFGTHTYPGKPGGTPTISNAQAIGIGGTGWYDLPVSFGQALASTPGGIGLNHGGYNKFAARQADAQSGALRIVSTY